MEWFDVSQSEPDKLGHFANKARPNEAVRLRSFVFYALRSLIEQTGRFILAEPDAPSV